MSSENSNHQNLGCSSFPLKLEVGTCGNLTVFPSKPPVSDSPYLPSSVGKPAIKKELEEKNVHCLPVTDKLSVPDWALSNWRSSQGAPGHFVRVANSPIAPLHPWHGPNVMDASTEIKDVFRYIKENLCANWTERIDLHITGFSPLHFPPRPIWRRAETFHIHMSSHLGDCDGLGAMRGEAIHRVDTPYLQIMIYIRPLRWI